MLKKRYKADSSADIISLAERLKSRLQLLQSRIALRKANERRLCVRHMPTKLLLRGAGIKENGEATDVCTSDQAFLEANSRCEKVV